MKYNELTIWREKDGKIWHSLAHRNAAGSVDEMAMSELNSVRLVESTIDWARGQGIKVVDKRGAA